MNKIKLKPLITVIVPIYNGALWLHKCMNSLVYQTLENIEIIAVDNGSTDNTRQILDQYAELFPNKVIVGSIEHTNGPGGGRNFGLSRAKADYIAFADCDDYFDYRAMEILYEKALSDDYDMVCCASYDVKNNTFRKSRMLKRTEPAYVLRNGSMVFWNKLIKKELFQQIGAIPENIVFEDIAYVSVLISASKKIGYIDEPLYYYILRDDSGVNDLRSERIIHSLEAYEFALGKCKKNVKEELIASIAHRVCFDLKKARWTFADSLINYIKKNQELFDIDKVKEDKSMQQFLERVYRLPDEPMDQIIYVNGFSKLEQEWMDEIQENAFWGGGRLIILNEENCDVNKLDIIKEAYEKQDMEFVATYFALEKIYETGGIYLSNRIRIINYFNCMRYCTSFWGYEDDENITDQVFGAIKRSPFILELLNCYQRKGIYQSTSFTLAERLKNILFVKYKIKLDGQYYKNEEICLLPADVFVTDIRGEFHVCRVDFSDFACKDDYVVVKRSTLNCFLK